MGTRIGSVTVFAVLLSTAWSVGLISAPTAAAATVQFHPGSTGGDPGYVIYRGEDGERNQLTVDYLEIATDSECLPLPLPIRCALLPTRFTFSDPGAPLIRPASEETVETLSNCLFLAVAASCVPRQGIDIDVGHGADTVSFRGDALTEFEVIFTVINGGPGNDVLSGSAFLDTFNPGPGSDRVSGGPNDDNVNAEDGEQDSIRCGSGPDFVRADPVDVVAADCENVV